MPAPQQQSIVSLRFIHNISAYCTWMIPLGFACVQSDAEYTRCSLCTCFIELAAVRGSATAEGNTGVGMDDQRETTHCDIHTPHKA